MMETSSLSPPPTIIVPDDHPCDRAPSNGTGRHPGAGPGVDEGGRPPQSPPAFGMLLRRRWQRGLAWGGLVLLISVVWGAPWLSRQPPLVPPSPPTHSDLAASALPGSRAPAAPPAPAARPPTQSQTPAGHASIVGTPPGGATLGAPLPRPTASLARDAAPRKPRAVAPLRAARAGNPPHARKRHATTRPRTIEYEPVGGAHRRGERSAAMTAPRPSSRWTTPNPAPEVERLWHVIPATGDG